MAKDIQREDAVELLKSIFFFGKMTGMPGASILWDRPQAERLHALPPQEVNSEKHIRGQEYLGSTLGKHQRGKGRKSAECVLGASLCLLGPSGTTYNTHLRAVPPKR